MLQRFGQIILYSKSSGRGRNCCWLRCVHGKSKNAEALMDSDTSFTDEERNNILDCFNRSSAEELALTKPLSRQKATAIVNYRETNGEFHTISGVLNVPLIGLLGLQRACGALKTFDHLSLQKMRNKLSGEAIKCYPHLTDQECESIDSVISLDLHPDRVSWIKMTRELEVEHWTQSILFDKPYHRFDHVIYMQQLEKFVASLPSASIYSMENKLYRVPNLRVMPLIVNLRCLEAMLITLLNRDYLLTKNQRVHLIKPTLISRYHELSVGGERVSGQHVVRNIIEEQDLSPEVVIPRPLTDSYFRLDTLQQEKLSNCLLQAITFWKLIILKSDSISV